MTEPTADILLPRLNGEFGYPEGGARLVAEKLLACAPQIKRAFSLWWETGNLTDLQIEGYSVKRLIDEHSMNPIAAFLTLDWLSREPEKARASLARGHDRIA